VLRSDGLASTYHDSTPPLAHSRAPCNYTFLISLPVIAKTSDGATPPVLSRASSQRILDNSEADEKGAFAALRSDGLASTYRDSTPSLAHSRAPCNCTFLISLPRTTQVPAHPETQAAVFAGPAATCRQVQNAQMLGGREWLSVGVRGSTSERNRRRPTTQVRVLGPPASGRGGLGPAL
jgi:hypothetical protein